jgi:hypothetical protein
MIGHSHRPQHSTETVYAGGGDAPATGGITVTDHCACGARRHTHRNGQHQDTGAWYIPGITRRNVAGRSMGRADGRGRLHHDF